MVKLFFVMIFLCGVQACESREVEKHHLKRTSVEIQFGRTWPSSDGHFFRGPFMSKWFTLFVSSILMSCANGPTPYQKKKKDEGYSDGEKDNLKISKFRANHYTKSSQARLYAEFRAIENCLRDGFKFANIIDIFDKSVRRRVTRTDGSVYGPSYYGSYGMYPFYSRYSGLNVGVNFSNVTTSSWDETYVYPEIEVLYSCGNSIYRPKLMFREVPAEEMKHLVKDIKGGVQIQKILDDSPNKIIFKENDILIRVNGKRIENVYEFISLFNDKTQTIDVDYLRDGFTKNAKMVAVDVTELAQVAEKKIIQQACKEASIKKRYTHDLCRP